MEITLTTISKRQIHSPRAKILTAVTVTTLLQKGAQVCLARTHDDQLAHSLRGKFSYIIFPSEAANRKKKDMEIPRKM